jgi:hypothetical protein
LFAIVLVLLGLPLYWLSWLMRPAKKGPLDLGLPQPPPTPSGKPGWR